MSPRAAAPALALLAALNAGAAEVTPYRPTVSNPAALSAPGRLEIEAGFARTRNRTDGTASSSVPTLLKYAFTEDAGVLTGGDANLRQTDASGARSSGIGDTSLALKLRRGLSGASALGLEAGALFATAAKGLGSGENDYFVNGIYSGELGDWGMDLNLGCTRFGAASAGSGRAGANWAAAIAHGLGGAWGLALEASGSARRGIRADSQLLGAITYRWSRRLALDAGLARGLNDAAAGTLFFGFAVLFGGD
jgi:hypothetical protein